MKTLRFRIDPETECWNVVSHDRGRDYPRIGRNGRYYKIHRWVFEFFYGPPGGLLVCHTCDNPRCINPEHLFIGTDADNMADKMRKGRLDMAWKRKLTKQEAREIKYGKHRWRYYMTKYDISPGTIAQIRQGKAYKEV